MKYVAVSGGADSTALALLMHERGEEFEMVFADTGAELPEVYWLLPRLVRLVDKPLHIVCNGTFYQHLTNQGFFLPNPRARWCTRVLKAVPQERFFAEGSEVAVGIRADEAHRNAGAAGKGGIILRPLVEAGMGRKDCHQLCEKHGLLNPVYEWRTRVNCFCCFFQNRRDWWGLLHNHPSLYALAEEWENQSLRVSGFGWHEKFTLAKLREQGFLPGFEEPDEEPCSICSW